MLLTKVVRYVSWPDLVPSSCALAPRETREAGIFYKYSIIIPTYIYLSSWTPGNNMSKANSKNNFFEVLQRIKIRKINQCIRMARLYIDFLKCSISRNRVDKMIASKTDINYLSFCNFYFKSM